MGSLQDHPLPRFRYVQQSSIIVTNNHQSNLISSIDEIQRVGNSECKHFSHRHKLLTYSLRASDCVHCYFCDTTISGMSYGCKRCRYFIHESCYEFPQVIEHLAHPGHQLILKYTPSISPDQFKCKACHHGDKNPALLFNFHYSCGHCDFALHIGCASMPYKVLHKEMALSVLYSNPLRNEAGPLLCDLCNQSIDKSNSWVYYHHSHNFVTHFGCVASVYGKGKNEEHYIMGVKDGLTNLDGDDTCIVNYQNNEHEGTQHNRFFHRHALQPLDRSMDNSYGQEKGCSSCDFIIHERCSFLPEKIQHPFHPHPLKLVPKKEGVEAQCIGCRQSSGHTNYTVMYQCKTCEFQLHPSCAACPRRLKKLDLTLCYSFPYKNEVAKLYCNYCSKVINKDEWLYYGTSNDEKRHITCQLAVGASNCYVTLRDLEVK
ncbi:unnamed protein product [Withania somnifera]